MNFDTAHKTEDDLHFNDKLKLPPYQQGSVYWKILPLGGKHQLMSFKGKNMKSGREKGKMRTKGINGKEKGERKRENKK
jgi:hypothetical protein